MHRSWVFVVIFMAFVAGSLFGPGSGVARADSSPDFTHFDGFWESVHNADTVDSQSATWITELYNALPTGNKYIQLAGSEDDGGQFGVATTGPPARTR